MIHIVVLLGPPGSGKSTIGAELGRRGFLWREWELTILERWGSRENFVAHKAEALPLLHKEIRAWCSGGDGVAVFETSGLSDAPLLDEIEHTGACFVVRLDVSETIALTRVAARESGRHLTDDLEASRSVWRAFRAVVFEKRAVDLIIDTERSSPEEITGQICEAVETLRS